MRAAAVGEGFGLSGDEFRRGVDETHSCDERIAVGGRVVLFRLRDVIEEFGGSVIEGPLGRGFGVGELEQLHVHGGAALAALLEAEPGNDAVRRARALLGLAGEIGGAAARFARQAGREAGALRFGAIAVALLQPGELRAGDLRARLRVGRSGEGGKRFAQGVVGGDRPGIGADRLLEAIRRLGAIEGARVSGDRCERRRRDERLQWTRDQS